MLDMERLSHQNLRGLTIFTAITGALMNMGG